MSQNGRSRTVTPVRTLPAVTWRGFARTAEPGPHASLFESLPVVALATAGVAVGLMVLISIVVLAFGGWPVKGDTVASIATASISLTALIGASLGGVYAYRRQILTERDGTRADQQVYTDRFVKAAELLSGEKATARIAGLHLLASLSDDWDNGREPCAMAVCAYLRLSAALPEGPVPIDERLVQRTAWSIIKSRLADPSSSTSWHYTELDFSGGRYVHVDLDHLVLPATRLNFRSCSFSGEVRLGGAQFGADDAVDFAGSVFTNSAVFLVASKIAAEASVIFDKCVANDTVFHLNSMIIDGELNLRHATITDSQLAFSARDGDHVYDRIESRIAGEFDMTGSSLTDTTLSMADYRVSGRIVLSDVVTTRVDIGLPYEMMPAPYINVDLIPMDSTDVTIGGRLDGGDLRIRPHIGHAPHTLTVSFVNFRLNGGDVLIAANASAWRKFYFDAVDEIGGSISMIGSFASSVEVSIDPRTAERMH